MKIKLDKTTDPRYNASFGQRFGIFMSKIGLLVHAVELNRSSDRRGKQAFFIL